MKVVTVRPRNRRARHGWSVGVLTILCVLLVVTAVSALVVLAAPGQGNAAGTTLRNQPGALPWDGRTPLTALLIGADASGTSPASSLVVAQYRPGTRSLSLLAIPGNLWITIPGFGRAPISQSYADGGSRLALVSVQSVLHLPIPFYATIDPASARQLIDAIGPVGVPATTSAGMVVLHQMDGAQTLRFVGIRPVDDGANRLRRELQALLATRTQIFGSNALARLAALVSQFGGSVGTNIPYSALPELTKHLGQLHSSDIHVAALDLANGSLTHYTGNGITMLLPDPAGAPALARRLLSSPTIRIPGGVAILNGAGVAGQANSLAEWLGQAGVPVSSTGSAASYTYAHTHVIVSRHASADERNAAQTISTLLQIPVKQGRGPIQSAAVSVVIGSDYQDPTQH